MALSATAGMPGPNIDCGLKHSLIVDSITTGPTGTLLCFLSSLRSPSRSGAHEPGDAFEPEQTRE